MTALAFRSTEIFFVYPHIALKTPDSPKRIILTDTDK
jgi:hypothetical protein